MTPNQRAQLGAFVQRKRTERREQERAVRRRFSHSKRDTSLELGTLHGVTHRRSTPPIGFHFTPQRHGLTLEQCRIATQLLRRANQERPIHGANRQAQFRRCLRIAGIVSAVKGGRVGNSHFGYRLHGHRGGNVMRDHGLYHLRTISPLGRQAARAAREGKKAEQVWEQRQSHPQTFEEWHQELTAWPMQELAKDFMSY